MLWRQPAQAGLTDDTMQHAVGGTIRLAAFWRLSDRAPRSFVSRETLSDRQRSVRSLACQPPTDDLRSLTSAPCSTRCWFSAQPFPKALVIPDLSMVVASVPSAPWDDADAANGMLPPLSAGLGDRWK